MIKKIMESKIKLLLAVAVLYSFCLKAQTSAATERKINALISKMTLEEKVNMIHGNSSFTSAGVPRLGIPELVTSYGPHDVRVEHGGAGATVKM